ncbi:hypothetical protein [Cellulomonas sp. KRMCY2]|nr:hypothetical protein [Cellulomonas sp. KRMCY2]
MTGPYRPAAERRRRQVRTVALVIAVAMVAVFLLPVLGLLG